MRERAFALLLAWSCVLAQDAHAYIDPGMGSFILQFLVAGVLGGLFTIKMYWGRLKRFVKGAMRKVDVQETNED